MVTATDRIVSLQGLETLKETEDKENNAEAAKQDMKRLEELLDATKQLTMKPA